MNRNRSRSASRMVGSASGCSQGEVVTPSSFQLFIRKRGYIRPACVQRIRSSAPGGGPAKPPTSWPILKRPESDMPSPVRKFHWSDSQLVVLSPLHVWAYRCRPGPPARVTVNGRTWGFAAS